MRKWLVCVAQPEIGSRDGDSRDGVDYITVRRFSIACGRLSNTDGPRLRRDSW